ncbi:MAG: DUF5693 family protein, partial [Endomicrobiales bacterium]
MKSLKSLPHRFCNAVNKVLLRLTGRACAPRSGVKTAVIFLLLGAAAVWAMQTVFERVRAERRNKTVEICLDLDELLDYCQLNNYPVVDFLERARAIGSSSLAVSEETVATLSRSGKIVFFTEQDFNRLRLLDLVPPAGIVSARSIVTADKALSESLVRQLKIRYALDLSVKRGGKYRVLSPLFTQPLPPSLWNENLFVGFSREKIDFAAERGFQTVLMPRNAGNPQWLEDAFVPGVSSLLWDREDVSGYPGKVQYLARRLKDNAGRFISLEFVTVPGQETLKREAPECLIRGHVILPRELNRNLDPDFWTSRLLRAVRERGTRFIFFHFWENKPVEDNLSYIRKTAQALKSSGYALGPAVPPAYPSRGNLSLWLYLAVASAVIFPLWGLYEGKKIEKPLYAYLATNFISLAGGIFISALLADVFFMQKVIEFPAVKAAMLAPLFLSVFLLYPPEKIKKLLSSPVQ